jgi:hypothetical protein
MIQEEMRILYWVFDLPIRLNPSQIVRLSFGEVMDEFEEGLLDPG